MRIATKLAVGALAASPALAFAQAQTIDVSAAISQLGEIGTAVAAVGGALIAAAAIAVGFKWVKGAIFS